MAILDYVPPIYLLFDTSAFKALNHKTSAEFDSVFAYLLTSDAAVMAVFKDQYTWN
jgi:hypothetical protein